MAIFSSSTFPWWYRTMLSFHLPQWLIQIMEQPEIAAYIVSGVSCILALCFLTLIIKLFLARRTIKKLSAERDSYRQQYEQLNHQITIAQLSQILQRDRHFAQNTSRTPRPEQAQHRWPSRNRPRNPRNSA